ncbi:MAG: tetratricopeptide repeat protein [Chthoniobacterales bacterium]
MDRTTKAPVELAIAHVLFIDIVGYSKLATREQNAVVASLNELVQECEPFRIAEKADRLLKIPTGDGMALVFYSSPEEPAQCAVALAQALKTDPNLKVRMGIHSGSVSGVVDVSGRANVAGAGINIAQRVMDCADAGHILISKHAADDLAEYERWRPLLHDLGSCEVKHGVKVQVANLWSDEVGNSRLPSKIRGQRQRVRRKRSLVLGSVAGLLAIGAFFFWFWRSQQHARAGNLKHSVAVLPFESLSTDPDNAILTGGVHREVLTNLAKIADLKVISRTSVMKYKPGTERNLKRIAEDLGVAFVVEGTVQREKDHVVVAAELIDASTDLHVWAQQYDGHVADVLEFQTEIAQRISNQLGAKLSQRERTELADKVTQDMGAFESYIRARALMEVPDDAAQNKQAVQLLEQAIARDPHFVAAYWALVEANVQLFRTIQPPNVEYRSRAEAALKEAQHLSPKAGETELAQARLVYYGYYDFAKALSILEQAAESLPNNAEVTLTRALLYRRFGRWQEAYNQFLRVTELNPQDLWGHIHAGGAAVNLRWWAECDQMRALLIKRFPQRARRIRIEGANTMRLRGDVEAGNKELEGLNPIVADDFGYLFDIAMWKHDYQEARRVLAEATKYPELEQERWQYELELQFVTKEWRPTQAAGESEKRLQEELGKPGSDRPDGNLSSAVSAIKMMLGEKDEAIRIAEESVQKHPLAADSMNNMGRAKWLAYAYLYAGEHDRAIQTLTTLVHAPGGEWYGPLKYDPVFDGLRTDPRFQSLTEQAKQPFPR